MRCMWHGIKWHFLIAALLTVQSVLSQQQPEFRIVEKLDVPRFYSDIVMKAGSDSGKTEVSVYVKIIYDALQFVKDNDQYRAEYELSISIFDESGEQVASKIEEGQIQVTSFKETNSSTDFNLTAATFQLVPGKHEILIALMDKDSKKTGYEKEKFTVPDYDTHDLSISSIFLKNQIIGDSAVYYEPNVYWNFGDNQEQLFAEFEIYAQAPYDSGRIGYVLTDDIGDTVRHIYVPHDLYKDVTSILFEIPRDNLSLGKYQLHVYYAGSERMVDKKHKLTIHWMDMPGVAQDINAAIEQLKYIARGKVLKQLKKAKGSEKARLFKEFWKSVDPTPDTDANELMQEYYNRVKFCNENFKEMVDGWKTDRGFVFILLGPPSDVERYPFESNSRPYQIWHYYVLNRSYVFVDRLGMGAYELITPIGEVLNQLH